VTRYSVVLLIEVIRLYVYLVTFVNLNKSFLFLTLPGRVLFPFNAFSMRMEAYPTLSEEIRWLVLFMLVGWTAYQLMTPIIESEEDRNFTCTKVLSTSYLYLKN
jgi:hypothetical protein